MDPHSLSLCCSRVYCIAILSAATEGKHCGDKAIMCCISSSGGMFQIPLRLHSLPLSGRSPFSSLWIWCASHHLFAAYLIWMKRTKALFFFEFFPILGGPIIQAFEISWLFYNYWSLLNWDDLVFYTRIYPWLIVWLGPNITPFSWSLFFFFFFNS